MPGLYISDPTRNEAFRSILARLLHDHDLPLAAFTPAAACVPADSSRAAFLRAASIAALLGQPIPLSPLTACLQSGDPLPGNVLRRHLFLRLSLMPYLRPGKEITQLPGCLRLGEDLLIVPVSPEDTVDVLLPPGIWTELNGVCHEGRLKGMRGYNETPLLARPNALLPVGMNGQSLTQTTADDADRLTLHWFQPEGAAGCTLMDGTFYHISRKGDDVCVDTNATKPFHLSLHRDGVETLVR